VVPVPLLVGALGVATAAVTARGVVCRRRAERRAAWLEVLAVAARRERPLAPVLRRAAEADRGRRRSGLLEAAARIEAGEGLADALHGSLRREVPAGVAEALRAAEGTARFPDVLEGLAAEAGRDLSLGHRAATAAVYPALLGLGLLLLHFVVLERRIGWMIDDHQWPEEGTPLPLVSARWLFLGVAAVVAASWLLRRSSRRAPDAAACRWLRTAAWALGAGRGLPEAMRRAAGATPHRPLRRATLRLATDVESGRPLDGVLAGLPFSSRVRARLEGVARVPAPALLEEIAASCEGRHVARRERWIRWAVPVATVVVGIVVAVDYGVLADTWGQAIQSSRP
jgi:type II secretory pathway component PulF